MKNVMAAVAAAVTAVAVAATANGAAKRDSKVRTKRIAPSAFKVHAGGAKAEEFMTKEIIPGKDGGAIRITLAWKKRGYAEVVVPLDGIDMLDDYPTIAYTIEQTQPGKPTVADYATAYGSMTEKAVGTTNVVGASHVSKIRREIGHATYWASWADVREMRHIRFCFPADSWSDQSAVQTLTISAVTFTSEDSWRGTDRDRRYRDWLKFCDEWKPDLSPSEAMLEPPKAGRVRKPFPLVKGGVAKAEIVLYPDAYGSVELAARELQHWIAKITGATLPIVTNAPSGAAEARIHLNAPSAAKRWAKDVEWLKGGADVDGYFVHADGTDVYIGCAVPGDVTGENAASFGLPVDACAVGVFRGAVAFLENNAPIIFACADKEHGTIYDKSPDFVVRWGEGRERPATCGRGWLGGTDFRNDRPIAVDGDEIWRARNRTNVRLPHRLSGHGARAGEMIEFFPNEDPYRAFDGTKRIKFGYYSAQVCLSAPDALDRAVEHAVRQIDASRAGNYPITSLGFWNEDNWLVCVCPGCTAPITLEDGTVLKSDGKTRKDGMATDEQVYRSTQYALFVNKLADAVAKQRPGVKTEVLAYFFQYPAPKCRISPNVAWEFAPYHARPSVNVPLFHPLCHSTWRNFERMVACGGEPRGYEYYAFGGIGNAGSSVAEASAADYDVATKMGGRILGAEMAYISSAKSPIAAMNGWLVTRASWNADVREVAKLRKYYIRRVFREGAPAVEAYVLSRLKSTLKPRRYDAPKAELLGPDGARDLFDRYLDKITNPSAKFHYEAVMVEAMKYGNWSLPDADDDKGKGKNQKATKQKKAKK